MDGNKGNGIFLSVIGIATLLVAIVGATFAWFSVQTEGEVSGKTEITTANLGKVVFANGTTATATGSDVYPGWVSEDITFTITATDTTEDIAYTVTAEPTLTGAGALADALQYNLSCAATGSGTCPVNVTNGSVPKATATYQGTLGTGNDVHTYTVNMTLPETGTDQNELQGLNYSLAFSVQLDSNVKYTQSGSTRTVWSN